MVGSNAARACTLSSCAIPWSVSAAWNWILLARARVKASCSVSVSGASVELAGCASCAGAIGTTARINSAMPLMDFLVDKGDLLRAPTVYGLQTQDITLVQRRKAQRYDRIRIVSFGLRA